MSGGPELNPDAPPDFRANLSQHALIIGCVWEVDLAMLEGDFRWRCPGLTSAVTMPPPWFCRRDLSVSFRCPRGPLYVRVCDLVAFVDAVIDNKQKEVI